MNTYEHIPVLLNEVIEYLAPKPGQSFIDATLGGGGYSQAILKEIGETGKLLSIDLDQDAIEHFNSSTAYEKTAQLRAVPANLSQMTKSSALTTNSIITESERLSSSKIASESTFKNKPLDGGPEGNRIPETRLSMPSSSPDQARHKLLYHNITLVQGNFSHIDHIVRNHKFPAPDGIVADLGLSSYELDQAGRGISFQKKEPLDMRFDQPGNTVDAKFILNNYGEKKLRDIFEKYGEEKFSRQIARKIVGSRQQTADSRHHAPIHYTTDLYQIIVDALPKPVKHKADDSARRIFQALRIEVNHELQNLEEFLPKAFDLLSPGGRLVVVSFHSLEDRIVKQFFVGLTKGCVCPIDFPQCVCGKNPQGKILTKKVIVASDQELKDNPRSKPAKLRAIMKI
jgi:16S rRNA (cytosine1402-N4)-methyltransferase